MLTFQEYKDWYYENGKCIDQIQESNNKLNEKQLATKYDNYLRKEEKRLEKILNDSSDEEWEQVKDFVWERDGGRCRLSTVLHRKEWNFFYSFNGFLTRQLDVAHVIPRSISSNLYYEPRNLVLLDRTFHSRLDFGIDPISGDMINREDIELWWIRIIGGEEWHWLNNNK